jgi:hypothetical protein
VDAAPLPATSGHSRRVNKGRRRSRLPKPASPENRPEADGAEAFMQENQRRRSVRPGPNELALEPVRRDIEETRFSEPIHRHSSAKSCVI